MEKLKLGIVGYGGLGHVHAGSLVTFDDIKVTCICDIDSEKFAQEKGEMNFDVAQAKIDLNTVNTYESFDEMLEKEELDIVVSALPTDIHAEYAIKALNKGINVFSEKPMCLKLEDCQKMIDARNKSGKELMIGQCVRFWGEYEFLEKIINNGRYGKLWSLHMQRYGIYPGRWFMDGTRSGGALGDLHVHDLDWINYKFGCEPDFMTACGLVGETGAIDDTNVLMKYGDSLISLRASWMVHNPFNCFFIANFEEATVEYRMEWGEIRISNKDQVTKETVKIDPNNAYAKEMRYFIDACKGLHKNEKCTAESTMDSIKLALREMDLIYNIK